MSEQNSMAINPVYAGLGGAAIGGVAGAFTPNPLRKVKSEYNSAQNLLTLENDKFEKLKPADDATQEIKDSYDTFKKGRTEIETAEKSHDAEVLKDLNDHFKDDEKLAENKFEFEVKDGDKTEKKTIKVLEDEVANIKNEDEVKNAVAEVQEVKDAKAELTKANEEKAALSADATAEQKTKADEKITNATKKVTEAEEKAFAANEKVKKAQELVDSAKEERLKQMKNAINTAAEKEGATDNVKTLAKKIKDGFDKNGKITKMTEGTENAYVKGFESLKGLLPKTKLAAAAAGAAILGLAGVALAYIVGPKNETPSDVA